MYYYKSAVNDYSTTHYCYLSREFFFVEIDYSYQLELKRLSLSCNHCVAWLSLEALYWYFTEIWTFACCWEDSHYHGSFTIVNVEHNSTSAKNYPKLLFYLKFTFNSNFILGFLFMLVWYEAVTESYSNYSFALITTDAGR